MTEAEWRGCFDPRELIRVSRSVSRRKWLLFASACARRAWSLVVNESPNSPDKLEAMAEQPPDTVSELEAVCAVCTVGQVLARASDWLTGGQTALHERWSNSANLSMALSHLVTISSVLISAARRARGEQKSQMMFKEMRLQCDLLRDIVGNPFRTPRLVPDWLTRNDGAVRLVAEAIEAERDYGRVCVLGDALQDAGCEDEEILAHCRGTPLARGCWVLDLLMMRE